MSYTYLLKLYSTLAARTSDIKGAIEGDPALSASTRQHLAGRRDCLESIHQFLEDHYDQKLPRRLQQQWRKAR